MANFHDEAVAKTLSMALSRDITAFSCEHKRSDLVPYMKLFGIKCGFKIDKQPLLSLFASLRTWVFGSDHLPILGPALHGRELLCTWIISGKLLPPLLADAVQGIRCHLGDWTQLLQKLFEDGLDLFLGCGRPSSKATWQCSWYTTTTWTAKHRELHWCRRQKWRPYSWPIWPEPRHPSRAIIAMKKAEDSEGF